VEDESMEGGGYVLKQHIVRILTAIIACLKIQRHLRADVSSLTPPVAHARTRSRYMLLYDSGMPRVIPFKLGPVKG
jgi:hypothetical protein